MNESIAARKNLAVELVAQQRLAEACELYRQICSAHPDDAESWQRFGALNGMLGQLDEVVHCSRKAIEIDPLLVPAYENLANALQRQGKPIEAVQCYWMLAMRMHQADRLEEARMALNRLLDVPVTIPEQQLVQVYRNLGSCCMLLGDRQTELECAQRLIELQPGDPRHLLQLGDALYAMDRYQDAEEAYRKLYQLTPDDAKACAGIAQACERIHKPMDAGRFANRTLELAPDNVKAVITLAKLDYRNGDLDEARSRLVSACDSRSDPQLLSALHYELGKVCDRLGQYAEAFESFRVANEYAVTATAARAGNAAADEYLRQFETLKRWFTDSRLQGWQGSEPRYDLPGPVFLVGHPRSGTTLTEQILSAQPGVVVSDEKPVFSQVVSAIAEQAGGEEGIPQYLDKLTPDGIASLRELYWQQAERLIAADIRDKTLVDKAPINLKNLGFIQRLFPQSKIIVALRDPRDVCLSCFMQHFAPNLSTAHFFDIKSTSVHYASLMGLWLHYRSVIRMPWIESRYEDLVTDFEASARRLIAFLDMEWDDAVLTYFNNKREISTPSYQDVASPVYSRAMGRWAGYRDQLQSVLADLEPFVREFGYAVD